MRFIHFTFVALLFAFTLGAACGNTTAEKHESSPPVVRNDSPQTDTLPAEMNKKQVTRETLLGQINPSADTDFVVIAQKYTPKQGIYLRRDAYAAFEKMAAQAKAAGFTLKILSATRTFSDQKKIWEDKWNGVVAVGGKNLATQVKKPVDRALAILTYSSMPGTSRHHWGTDIDLNSLEPAFFESGEGKKLYEWLVAHAHEFGYCQPYTRKDSLRPNGYNEEKWHWSYTPISMEFLNEYKNNLKLEDIQGFAGSETAGEIGVIEKYVLGVNRACK